VSTKPALNSFIRIEGEAAMREAETADREMSRGVYRGPLHGVPLAHKDVFDIEGRTSSAGFRTGGPPAHETAPALALLNSAGAINLGALNLDEACASGTGRNRTFGDCRNPRHPDRISGGSSSGSAASVAACQIFGSLGTDTGGSIRWPAAMCGVVGLKPTNGLVSTRGVFPLTRSMDSVGPLARSVADCALILRTVMCADNPDWATSAAERPRYRSMPRNDLRGIRVAVAAGVPFEDIEPDLARCLEDTLAVLQMLGARLIKRRVAMIGDINELHKIVRSHEGAALHGPLIRKYRDRLLSETIDNLSKEPSLSEEQYRRAMAMRRPRLEEFLSGVLDGADILFMPMLPGAAPSRDVILGSRPTAVFLLERYAAFSRLANYLGIPSLALPCGFSSDGLPYSAQLCGRPFDEDMLLTIGSVLERTMWPAARHPKSAGASIPQRCRGC
jgi:aspartyl-tRNA(Asn)/glutamyl-tRNA(Gln) amidotransferase subunit A